jgi:hypothetical protein
VPLIKKAIRLILCYRKNVTTLTEQPFFKTIGSSGLPEKLTIMRVFVKLLHMIEPGTSSTEIVDML